ncbi:hypothetical protein Tco_0861902, partial [Tanacetum coccineum]
GHFGLSRNWCTNWVRFELRPKYPAFGVHEAVVFNEKLLSQNTLANEALRLGNEAPRLDVKLVSQNDYVGEALGLDGKLLSQSNSANVTPGLDSKILFQIIL